MSWHYFKSSRILLNNWMEIIILVSKHTSVLVKGTLDLKIENFNEKIKKQKISLTCFNSLYWGYQIKNKGFQKPSRDNLALIWHLQCLQTGTVTALVSNGLFSKYLGLNGFLAHFSTLGTRVFVALFELLDPQYMPSE